MDFRRFKRPRHLASSSSSAFATSSSPSHRSPLAKHPLAFLALASLALLPSPSLGFSSLERPPRGGFLETVLEGNLLSADQRSCTPTGQIQDACCDFESVEQVNSRLHQQLARIVQLPIFRYHKVDLSHECPFWEEDGFCGNRACAVDELDTDHVPEYWRSESLGKLKTAKEGDIPIHFDNGCVVKEQDFCVSDDDENASSHAVYVDLLANPERFTGYAGPSAARVWKAIYEENCFDLVVPYHDGPSPLSTNGESLVSEAQMGLLGVSKAKGELSKLMGSVAGPRDGGDEMCLEKRVFYRLISGLHASISIHICDEYLDPTTGEWSPNLQCFVTRIAQHPERLQNVYFDYIVMLRALEKAGPRLLASFPDPDSLASSRSTKKKPRRGSKSSAASLQAPSTTAGLELCTGDDKTDVHTRKLLSDLVAEAGSCPGTFDETSMFTGPGALQLKNEFKGHFRNVSRIMDCVGCDKCRLWGKLQVTGLGTALKLLFGLEDDGSRSVEEPQLTRSELIAFINTLHRLSESLSAIDKFRKLWKTRSEEGTLPREGRLEREDAGDSSEAAKKADISPGLGPRAAAVDGLIGAKKKKGKGKKAVRPSTATPASSDAPASAVVTPRRGSTSSMPATQELRARQPETLTRLIERCRASWQACFEWIARTVSSLAGLSTPHQHRRGSSQEL